MPANFPSARRPRGFTLIELLVVIGIIVVLISILLPVIGAVRRRANETATTAELGRIAAGIQAYYNDFRAYPGPIPEATIDAGTVTSTENLTLGLIGGMDGATNTYKVNLVNKGPQSLNTLRPKQYNEYVNVQPGELSPQDGSGNYQVFNSGTTMDTAIPEFLDHIPGNIIPNTGSGVIPNGAFETGPILYFRARVGQGGIVAEQSTDLSQQYHFTQAAAYGFTQVAVADYPLPSPNPPASGQPTYTSVTVYFANPNISGTPKSKDTFILISAGTDRKFGTKDDIIYAN